MAINNITKDTFQKEILEFPGVVLIDFYADWCGPCKMLAPILEEISSEYKTDQTVKITKINVDEEMELSSAFQIQGIPTIIAFKQGHMVHRQSGFAPKDFYKKLIEEAKKVEIKE